jgi:hypothetical protein
VMKRAEAPRPFFAEPTRWHPDTWTTHRKVN